MLRTIGSLFGAFIALLLVLPSTAGAATDNISILYTADTQGRLRSFHQGADKPIGGVAKRAIYFQEKRRHTSMTWLTLDTGDALSGTALADVFEGYVCIQAMNRLKYDAMSLGVHDFDFGISALKQRISEAEFPVVSANLKYIDTGQPFTTPYAILEKNGTRIAIFGLITGDLGNRVAPANFTGLQALDPVETARILVPQLESQADVIVALTHMGINEDIRLASEIRGIDVIIGGMSHSELQVPLKFEDTLIVHCAEYGRNVGLLKLSFDPTQNYRQVYFANDLEPMAGKWVENSDYVAWLDSFNEQLHQRMDVIIGSAAMEMSPLKIRSAETPLGNYVTDVLREKTRADVAILPAAFFVNPLPEGPITLGDLYSALPFEHYAEVLEVTGGELQEILDEAADQIGKPGFPQVSGVSFGILGGKAYTVMVGGQQLDLFSTYRVATSDALAEGNYGYSRLGTVSRRIHTGLLIRDIIRERLATGQLAQSSVYQRVQFHAYDSAMSTPASTPPPSTEITAPPTESTYQPPAETTTPPAETMPPADTTPPADTMPPATDTTPPPADTTPPADTPPPTERPIDPETGRPVTDEMPPDTGTSPDSLDSLRYDRNGQPIGQPVIVEDVTLEDTGSDVIAEPAATTPPDTAPTTAPATAPATETPATTPSETTTPSTTPPTDSAGERVIGTARNTIEGLGYLFTLVSIDGEYEFRLQISNTTNQPIEVNYDSGAKFDFLVMHETDLLWSYNSGRFFVQSPESQTLAPGEVIMFGGEWDGLANDGSLLPRTTLRFDAEHLLSAGPVRLQFTAALPQ